MHVHLVEGDSGNADTGSLKQSSLVDCNRMIMIDMSLSLAYCSRLATNILHMHVYNANNVYAHSYTYKGGRD